MNDLLKPVSVMLRSFSGRCSNGLGLILLLFASIPSLAAIKETAHLSIYLFVEGNPAEIEGLVDNQKPVRSDANGSIYLVLPPGEHNFQFGKKGGLFAEFSQELTDGENTQIIVTLFKDGREPNIEIESSRKGKGSAALKGKGSDQASGEGIVQGFVVSAETQKPIGDALVYISGVSQDVITDQNGSYKARIPSGSYTISVVFPGFQTQTRNDVVVAANQTIKLPFELPPSGLEMEEYVVLEPHFSGSLTSVMDEQKTSASVSNVLGSEQITRAGDSDVAGALKRASGLTLVGGKFVFIRGLGERYSSTLINGASVPSPDPTRRVVPLDLFPVSVLDSVLIQKSYSADRPGEFAGGTIELRTRGIPDEGFFQINGRIGFVDGTTFSDGLRYEGGGTDFLGFDDGARELPASLASATEGGTLSQKSRFNPDGFTAEEIGKFGEDLSDVWDVERRKIGPDANLGISMGNQFDVGQFNFGFISAVRWSQEWNTQDEVRRTFAGSDTGELLKKTDFDFTKTEREIKLNGYLALEANYGENHTIAGRALVIRQSVDEASIQEGFTDAETNDIRRHLLEWIENQLFMRQIEGNHVLEWVNDLEINWLYSKSRATRKAPKERRFRYDANNMGGLFFSRRADSNQTIYGDLTDNDESWRLDVKLPLEFHKNFSLNLLGGFISLDRDRQSEIRRFDYGQVGPDSRDQDVLSQPSLEDILNSEFIGPNGFQLGEQTRPTDNYTATQELFSYYGSLDINVFETLRITGGLRWEENDQEVLTFKLFDPDNQPISAKLEKTDMLPAVAATWTLTDKQQVRASFSDTISRPDFRELSEAPFTDPVNDRETIGNPELQQTEIRSFDLRWEYYFSETENFSLGYFRKELTNPIELVFLAGPGGLLRFENANQAEVWGFEVELLKNLDFIHPRLEHFYVGGNYTWSESSIQLNEENLRAQTTSTRPLQGHSPYVINAQIGYDNQDLGTMATLLYNVAGKRVAEVGTLGVPDKFEQPFNQLDFVFRQRVNDWFSFNLRFRNLLDDKVVFTQGTKTSRSFRRGREFALGATLNF